MTAVLSFADIDSTNAEALRQAAAGAADGVWIIADRQSAGRGRRARAWISEPGNLYCTRIIRLAAADPPRAQLSFVTALALINALDTLADPKRLSLKWPNDVLLDQYKCSGILLESVSIGGETIIAAGIGVNLVHHPRETERPATSLAAAGIAPPAPADLLALIAARFDLWRSRWHEGGFAGIRSQWLARATGLGQRITVRLAAETLDGVFHDLDDEGALLLRLDSGRLHPVHAGDVFGI